MQKRTRYSLLVALALPAALIVAIVLRKSAPPEAARLLPESDAIVYINLKPIRSLTHFDRTPITRNPEFQHFIDATGIEPERDLDAVAFALHRMDDPNGPNGPVAYSEVFEGRFDGARLDRYLRSIATESETYAGHTIYTIPVAAIAAVDTASGTHPAAASSKAQPPLQVRFLRITQLGYDTLAASNMPTAEQIHSILERFRAGASPFAGSSLLEARYRDVPLLSSAWAIGHIGLPFSTRGSQTGSQKTGQITAFGLELPLPEDTTFVASLRYTGSIRLRVDEILPSVADATRSAQALGALLDLFRSFERQQLDLQRGNLDSTDPEADSAKDAELRQLLDSLKIQQQNDRAILTATMPLPLLKQLTAATP